ncbi:chromate efflux transporter [Brevundimonas sp. Root1423]|uniref:chromate efflux transporter n=1 Tax=Brevundimonas sp. Root1423 TaxID=1736462 RepID=UPI0006FDEC48|nr:chromate efflux transporter [Brevundimonas sp. Root1423]KQY75071.1 chromate transporter [Brevundimonas sp. Root1423]
MTEAADPHPPDLSYPALFLRFLRFGLLAFGGPVAQIAMIRRELVEEERWVSSARFNRLLAVMQVLPGPEAHELCVHLGIHARGRIGGLLAGLGFMLPGFALMLLAAWAYFRFDVDRGLAGAALVGAQAAVVALIVRAVHRIGEHVLTDRGLWTIGVVACVATLLDAPFWVILPVSALIHVSASSGRRGEAALLLASGVVALGVWSLGQGGAAMPVSGASPPPGEGAWPLLFVSGLKAGLLTFGGAYTAIPFLRQDVVGRGWLGDGTFLDGVALSNVLPAPLIIFATFAGYAVGGLAGALAITAGVFLPAFAFSMIFYDRLEAVVSDPRIRSALDGVAAAVVGLIAATAINLAIGLTGSPLPAASIVIACVALAALYVVKSRYAPPAILVLAGLAGLSLALI